MRSFYLLLASLPLFLPPANAQSITGVRVPCENGYAAGYSCNNIHLLSKLAMADYEASEVNDVWGWTDPSTGREYALAGHRSGLAFIDITDPLFPVYLGNLPSHNNRSSVWRDVKVWYNHAFVVADNVGDHGMQVFDLTLLRGLDGSPVKIFAETAHYDQVTSVHNIAINEETGYAYLVGASGNSAECPRGLHIVDVWDPKAPIYAGCFRDMDTGRSQDGYVHDVQCVNYRGPDPDYAGREICLGSNETHLSIADVTDKQAPVKIASSSYPDRRYSHQGWLSKDHSYFFMNDEGDEWAYSDSLLGTRTIIWDVEDLDDPIVHGYHYSPVLTIDHNLYTLGSKVFLANYTSGLRVVDASDIDHTQEIGFFDTHPANDSRGFSGAWSSYPYFASGTIVVSSDPEGLFMLELDPGMETASEPGELPNGITLEAAYPNPFNPSTTVKLTLEEAAEVDVRLFDAVGREVALLAAGRFAAGTHALDVHAADLPSGTYLVVARAADWQQARSVTLIK